MIIAGLVANFAGTLMFIWRFVGFAPKSVTRVSAPLAVIVNAATPLRTETEICITNFVKTGGDTGC